MSDSEIPWTVACQAPLSMRFSRQEDRSELPFPSPGDLPDPEIEPTSLESPALAGEFFTNSTTSEALKLRLKLTKRKNKGWIFLKTNFLTSLMAKGEEGGRG